LRAASGGNALATTAVNDLWLAAFFWRHGANDGFGALHHVV
jgi:hypothetical protein